ncbi:TylF/MycF/NovP-related O-methyltransferase [uncultured Brevundimonas sp.]|uniref:TylF/MycF/NovP-related O-methyltransferase n=1 Tax=uncultured Brevundimonas sp. TaxID=213418 RepID=UPI0026323901|nr:TylF/MycF/NovP-related O-methyltransferase [uncultured Brevundimonas sp.]
MSALVRAGYSDITLPAAGMINQIIQGRNLYDGTVRGVGLESGTLSQILEQHPLFLEAFRNAEVRSVVEYRRIMNLFLILSLYFDPLSSKDVIEFGSYKGGSAVFIATVLKRLYPGAKVYTCDTFEGMPKTDMQFDLHKAGDFADTDMEDLLRYAESIGLDNLVAVKGLVEDTFPSTFSLDQRFGLAHIDLDIYHSIKYIQSAVYPYISRGGYVVYDDATASTCLGATQAVEEWIARGHRCEQIYPHFVFRAHL